MQKYRHLLCMRQLIPAASGAVAVAAELPGVRAADLSSNHLTAIPSTLSSLTSLAALRLSSNSLQDSGMPWGSLAALGPSLTSLLMDENELSKLPKELGRLSRLVRLSVGSNALVEVEVGALGPLSMLQSLQLSSNKLERLPDDIGECVVWMHSWLSQDKPRFVSG
jgi:Leucine-rich repeat (LRR) protein